jgi:Endonuclease/Exonuclease/phosphatase family
MQALAPMSLLAGLLAATPVQAAGNLRIGTYNTHLIVDPFGASDWATESEKDTAATELAARINASDYDVLVLNEVFDEDARSIIHTQTRAKYPYQVVKVWGFATAHEDSGLMLLSRHPFVADPVPVQPNIQETDPAVLPRPAWQPRGSIYRNGSTSDMAKYVSFARYSDCGGNDCYAEKGVGIVAINITMGSQVRRTAFLFTHLQADDGRAIRAKQFATIQKVFGAMDYANRFTKDDVFIMGDLNIRGEDTRLDSEWAERFAGSTTTGLASWFANGGTAFREAWYNEGFNAFDKGITHNTQRDRQRLDYILRNTGAKVRSSNLCDQHMGRAYNLQFGPGTINDSPGGRFRSGFIPTQVPTGLAGAYNFSDHHGLNMELGPLTDHCSPATEKQAIDLYGDARYGVKDLLASDQNVITTTPISAPGAVYWYRITISRSLGAWAFLLANNTSPGSNIDIYEGEDFSRPIRSYKGDLYYVTEGGVRTWAGRKFQFEKPVAYYIKVSLKDRNATGTVRWFHRKLDCGSQTNYCPLAPNNPSAPIVMTSGKGFPDPTTDLAGQTVHAIDVPPLYAGGSQTLVIGELGAGISSGMTLMVTDSNNNLLGQTGTKLSGDADCRDANGGVDIACRKLSVTVTGPKRLYIYNIRAHYLNPESFRVFWKSPAVVVTGSRRSTFDYIDLSLIDAKDGGVSGNDELRMGFKVDGVDVAGYTKLPLNSEFEEGETYWLDYFLARLNFDKLYFKNNFTLRFQEEDDFLNGGDDHVTVDFTSAQMVPATGAGSYGVYSAAKYDVGRQFNLSNRSDNSLYRIWLGASRGWPADCFTSEAIGCHQAWQDWDMNLIFP